MDEQSLDIVNCICGRREYYGMMIWKNGKTFCRACMYKIWEEETRDGWKPLANDYIFPAYEDGKDYSNQEPKINKKTMKEE